VSVTYADDEPNGLAAMLGALVEQNLARDPGRRRQLHPCVAAFTVPDADVGATLRISRTGVEVANHADTTAHLSVTADADLLLALAAAPLLLGFPDPFRREGRAALRAIARREVRVEGMLRHPRRLQRLDRLLSAAETAAAPG
jgi:hypothetical protein